MRALRQQFLKAQIQARRDFHKAIRGRAAPKRRRLPRQQQPDRQRELYYRLLLKHVLEPMLALLKARLVPELPRLVAHAQAAQVKLDAIEPLAIGELYALALRLDAGEAETADEILDRIFDDMLSTFAADNFDLLINPIVDATAGFSEEQLAKQFRAGVGVDVLQGQTPEFAAQVEQFTRVNVALIKSIPREFLGDLAKRLTAGISSGLRPEVLATMISDRYQVVKSRAALIARDQVGKFFGKLNEARQVDAGVKSYVWRTAMDNRVREEHAMREGQSFDWDDPPADGHPGDAINCRCFAEPDLSGLLDETAAGPSEDVDVSDF